MIAYEKAGDEVFLVITDHLDWVAGDSGRREHIEALKVKIETYLWFVESGEFARMHPELAGRRVKFHIYFKYDIHPDGLAFLAIAKERLASYDIGLQFEAPSLD